MSKSFDSHLNNRHSKTHSFSSLLLDSIYRSLDVDADESSNSTTTTHESHDHQYHQHKHISDPIPKQNQPQMSKKEKSINLKRAIMIDHWIDKQQDEQDNHYSCVPNRKPNRRATSSESCFTPLKIRTTFADSRSSPSTSRPFITRTKSRALKLYGELKKAKQQPIPPGAKIASFLNSIFTAGSNRNNKPQNSSQMAAPSTTTTSNSSSACSSASSFSRSCLSKMMPSTSSTSGQCDGNAVSCSSAKRSVRFYPLSVIVGEDSSPCGHRFLYERSDPKQAVGPAKLTKIPNVGRSNPWCLENGINGEKEEIDDGEREDAESYASSDLFELENIRGMYGYDEELPVYGTTSFEKNKAIANENGFL